MVKTPDNSPNFFGRNAHRAAPYLAALSLVGGVEASAATAAHKPPAHPEKTAKDPEFAASKEVINGLASGKFPNEAIGVILTFQSTTAAELGKGGQRHRGVNLTPSTPYNDYWLADYTNGHDRGYLMAQMPIGLRRYHGHDWLVLFDFGNKYRDNPSWSNPQAYGDAMQLSAGDGIWTWPSTQNIYHRYINFDRLPPDFHIWYKPGTPFDGKRHKIFLDADNRRNLPNLLPTSVAALYEYDKKVTYDHLHDGMKEMSLKQFKSLLP